MGDVLGNLELVKAGLAWHYVKYAPDRRRLAETFNGVVMWDRQARNRRGPLPGLWAGS